MQKIINVLEDGYINTYEIFFGNNDYFKYQNILKDNYSTIKTINSKTECSNYNDLKRELLIGEADIILDMQLSDRKIEEIIEPFDSLYHNHFYHIYYEYEVKYQKYPVLYHLLYDNKDNMIHNLYRYLNDDISVGSNYDEDAELCELIGFNEHAFDKNISLDDKKKIISDILASLIFRKINMRLANDLDEYKKIEKETADIKKLINFVNPKQKVKILKGGIYEQVL